MDLKLLTTNICAWLTSSLQQTKQKGFVVGISGGIDSAVVSTLCARTGKPTILLSLPILQDSTLAKKHILWLRERYANTTPFYLDLSTSFKYIAQDITNANQHNSHFRDFSLQPLMEANLRSRLRMCALYAFANYSQFLVVGTGNKIEDYGVGFCTKGGDGLADISPIGDLLKSEVRQLGKYLGILNEIVKATPTDGLWEDSRSDEDQLGATYDELEWAMSIYDMETEIPGRETIPNTLTPRQIEVLNIYRQKHLANAHKMKPAPVFKKDI